jgi:hypothetical protein
VTVPKRARQRAEDPAALTRMWIMGWPAAGDTAPIPGRDLTREQYYEHEHARTDLILSLLTGGLPKQVGWFEDDPDVRRYWDLCRAGGCDREFQLRLRDRFWLDDDETRQIFEDWETDHE